MLKRQLIDDLFSAEVQGSASQLVTSSFHHFINDGYKWSLYPLLYLIADEFGLTYGATGAINTAYNALLSATSIPFGFLAERIGELTALTLGTAVFCVGFALLSLAWSYPVFLGKAFIAGAGSGAAHPIGSSYASGAAPEGRMGTFIGVFNFAGDVGKAVVPILAGILASFFGWRVALFTLGAVGVFVTLGLDRWARDDEADGAVESDERIEGASDDPPVPEAEPADHQFCSPSSDWGVKSWLQFAALNAVGILDSLARAGVVVFASFVLQDKGFSTSSIGGMLSLIAVGGSLGKLLCGPLGDIIGKRTGIIGTEVLTSATMLLFIYGSGWWMFPVLVVMGFFLNGTSSILYALVPHITTESGRSRGFGMYYTTTLATHGLSPLIYGVIGDWVGLYPMYQIMAAALLLTVPVTLLLKTD